MKLVDVSKTLQPLPGLMLKILTSAIGKPSWCQLAATEVTKDVSTYP
jgi:hypothetical protein